jgi:BCCT family betaine/carnitine transporter
MAVSTGFPFTIVLLLMCVSLLIGLNQARKDGARAAGASRAD